jgi:hypothetical protein
LFGLLFSILFFSSLLSSKRSSSGESRRNQNTRISDSCSRLGRVFELMPCDLSHFMSFGIKFPNRLTNDSRVTKSACCGLVIANQVWDSIKLLCSRNQGQGGSGFRWLPLY